MKRIEEDNRRVMEEQEEEKRKAREKAAEVKTSFFYVVCFCFSKILTASSRICDESLLKCFRVICQLPIDCGFVKVCKYTADQYSFLIYMFTVIC